MLTHDRLPAADEQSAAAGHRPIPIFNQVMTLLNVACTASLFQCFGRVCQLSGGQIRCCPLMLCARSATRSVSPVSIHRKMACTSSGRG